jgi:hypothetical protein
MGGFSRPRRPDVGLGFPSADGNSHQKKRGQPNPAGLAFDALLPARLVAAAA